jgi:protein-disulfide isomerase
LSAAIDRRALILGALSVAAGTPTLASPEPQRVPIELVEEALELEAAIRVGNRQGDVTLVEFFDYNCPWCRRSAADLPALLGAEPELAYVLVNFAVLGAPSVQATKVALASSASTGRSATSRSTGGSSGCAARSTARGR